MVSKRSAGFLLFTAVFVACAGKFRVAIERMLRPSELNLAVTVVDLTSQQLAADVAQLARASRELIHAASRLIFP